MQVTFASRDAAMCLCSWAAMGWDGTGVSGCVLPRASNCWSDIKPAVAGPHLPHFPPRWVQRATRGTQVHRFPQVRTLPTLPGVPGLCTGPARVGGGGGVWGFRCVDHGPSAPFPAPRAHLVMLVRYRTSSALRRAEPVRYRTSLPGYPPNLRRFHAFSMYRCQFHPLPHRFGAGVGVGFTPQKPQFATFLVRYRTRMV